MTERATILQVRQMERLPSCYLEHATPTDRPAGFEIGVIKLCHEGKLTHAVQALGSLGQADWFCFENCLEAMCSQEGYCRLLCCWVAGFCFYDGQRVPMRHVHVQPNPTTVCFSRQVTKDDGCVCRG